jgi:hypothetical protein
MISFRPTPADAVTMIFLQLAEAADTKRGNCENSMEIDRDDDEICAAPIGV